MAERSPRKGSLPVIIRSFKAAATRIAHEAGFTNFSWQSRFYEHIIRDGEDFDRISEYIAENPANWKADEEYPRNLRIDPIHRGAPV